MSDPDPLAGFSAPTREWFSQVFTGPTPAQQAAWQAIASGRHALVIAPTGSGKTLAAFLHSLDRLSRPGRAEVDQPRPGHDGELLPPAGVRVLYVSPLKALAVDVERNLRAPLRGIQATAARLGLDFGEVRVAVRSGDTPSSERHRLLTHPPEILITTPESLFLMLSSQAGRTLREVQTVIVDEVHALAGSKRGAHLALSLEGLDALNVHGEVQRIGLSATVRPPARVAAFLAGDRPVEVIQPPSDKQWELVVRVPVEDLTELAVPTSGGTDQQPGIPSIWPHVEEAVLDLIEAHRSTICFANSRRVAERLTAHLNELHAQRLGLELPDPPPPAQVMGASDRSLGMDGQQAPVIARAHHGSVSKERRTRIEEDLKAGRLRCVVATSSLELGIDMGAVDLVIQIQSPPSVASALQRVGRAGHQVGASSRGVFFPTARGDLVESAVVIERMRKGLIEQVPRLRNPLDVLAQQILSMVLDDPQPAQQIFELVRRADPFRDLPRSAFDGVLDMLAGRYPSEDFAELRPRVIWDRGTDLVTSRPGGRRLVTTSGGTIPDRGLFGVFLVGAGTDSRRAGRRVGELDEEMVYESRVGDVFTLGTTSWRIEEITANQVLVSPAPGRPGRLPFWKGDAPARPAELGRAIGDFLSELARSPLEEARNRLLGEGLEQPAASNLISYLADQREATTVIPGGGQILLERFRDELGDWRVCVHCSIGSAVLTPWALLIERRARQRFGVEAHAHATNDGIILRIPDVEAAPPGLDLLVTELTGLEEQLTEEVFSSALFAARFRQCAARALLLPRRDPGRRSPLWQQRLRSAQLLQVAANYPDFPIVLEAMRECLEDVFDLPALRALLTDINARRIRLSEVETTQPSPFARSLLFGYVGEFVYDEDQPLAERRMAALSLDPTLLAELLGREPGQALIDPEALAQLEQQLQRLAPDRRAGSAEQLWDLLRTIGPLSTRELAERSELPPEAWLEELARARRVMQVGLACGPVWAVTEDADLLRDALGIPAPPGVPEGPLGDPGRAVDRLVLRWLLHHTVVTPAQLGARYGLAPGLVAQHLERLVASGSVVRVDLEETLPAGQQYCHQRVMALLRRRTLAGLRAQVEPVEPVVLGRFLAHWHDLVAPSGGRESLLAAVDQLAGYPLPASMLESVVLPARVKDYQPGMLDELLTSGEVVWTGHSPLSGTDGWLQLWPADLVLAVRQPGEPSPAAAHLIERMSGGGAWRLSDLSDQQYPLAALTDAIWELVWLGMATSESFAPVRELCHSGALRRPRQVRVQGRSALRPTRTRAPLGTGVRWSLLPAATELDAAGLAQAVTIELARYGVLTRGSVQAEAMTPQFSPVYRILASMEESGLVRRGYLIEGSGAAQFAMPGAVDRLREDLHSPLMVLAACDPANPYGAALAWPESAGHRPTRKAGALVAIADGAPVAYLERGARTLVTFTTSQDQELVAALQAIGALIDTGAMGTVSIERINQAEALGDPRWAPVMAQASFAMVPQGYRRRRSH